jgi:hypothetical protein
MPARLLTISIIGFWLVMSGMLVQSIWFPADSRLSHVNPGAVLQLIGARGEPSVLEIYDDRKIVGRLSVQANRIPSTQPDRRPLVKMTLNGRMQLKHPLFAGVNLTLDALAVLDHGGEVRSFHLNLSTGANGLLLIAAQPKPDAGVLIRLTQDRKEIFNSSIDPTKPLEENPWISALLTSFGVSPDDLMAVRRRAESQAAGVGVDARQGEFEIEGRKRQGFVLKFGTSGQPGYRLSVENTGEIVRLETPTAYHLLSEGLRPPNITPP